MRKIMILLNTGDRNVPAVKGIKEFFTVKEYEREEQYLGLQQTRNSQSDTYIVAIGIILKI